MIDKKNFETYILISEKKLSILVKDNVNGTKLFENEFIYNESKDEKKLLYFDRFLEENIFKIEKILNSFVNSVILIINERFNLKIATSFKKKNYGNILNNEELNNFLKDAKNQIKENYKNCLIAHMIIIQYLINDQKFNYLPTNIKCEYVCLDIDFICFSKDYIKNLENILNKYHIQINKFLCANYIENYFKNENIDIFSMSEKIIEGYNENEIFLVPKLQKNKGFFERFFNFFG